ncbi:9361_t:CDS:2 [Cetraspora pellucida]|uniref:9361_t:CDS:1 n=1 Tax=Cetraspora pellucida TaxID=1433469 RepID=A0ACA9LUE3_9GLOM|nr:9361_t:CDS:2 [Cetraspora pellucida]
MSTTGYSLLANMLAGFSFGLNLMILWTQYIGPRGDPFLPICWLLPSHGVLVRC